MGGGSGRGSAALTVTRAGGAGILATVRNSGWRAQPASNATTTSLHSCFISPRTNNLPAYRARTDPRSMRRLGRHAAARGYASVSSLGATAICLSITARFVHYVAQRLASQVAPQVIQDQFQLA